MSPEIQRVAREFESVFLHQLLKSMRSTVREGKVLGGGRGGAIFSDLFDQAVSRTGSGTLGLASLLVNRYGAR
jgi:Rod binding domain-containing protein